MHIKELCITKNLSIIESIRILDETAKKILMIVEDNKLIGTVTDGDIRRWILKNGDLNESILLIMNCNPIYLFENDIHKAEKIMQSERIEAIPILNKLREVVDIVFWHDKFEKKLNYYHTLNNPVVIMAGGKGTRLYPYTKILPKPLIPIGELPIVERIINSFLDYGCDSFYLTVNYKKDMIKAYFQDKDRDYELCYIEEEKFLGTGGSLYLLKDKINNTFFVSNCDVLIDANYSDILQYHIKEKNKITMVTSLKNYTIPYGVITFDDKACISNIEEKPQFNFQVNTGLYVLEPEVLNDIPENEFFHITDLISKYIANHEKIGVYPVTQNAWFDMGEIKEMEKTLDRFNF